MLLGGILFILGLVVGSAINSFLWRYQTKTTYKGRSMCPVCKHKIFWYDNIPLISWLLLSGKCRHCKKAISVQYPIVEGLTAIAFALVGAFSASGIYLSHLINTLYTYGQIFKLRFLALGIAEVVALLAVTAILIIIAVHDYKTKEIPNGFNAAFIGFSLGYLILSNLTPRLNYSTIFYAIVAAGVAFSFFYTMVFFSKETWMGGGDAKMAFGMGLLLGPAGVFLAIMLGSILGSVYGLTAIALDKKSKKRGRAKLSTQIPFGPFLATGTFIAVIAGPQMIAWYVRIILGT